CARGITTVDHW
nr:immunoglobulin heavy chain junction region [Mus musculus]